MAPLKRNGKEGIRTGGAGPDAVIEPHHPKLFEAHAGSFQNTQDLDRGLLGLRLEHPGASEAAESSHSFLESNRAAAQVQSRKLRQQVVPGRQGLVFDAVERAVAGPAGGPQQARRAGCPGAEELASRGAFPLLAPARQPPGEHRARVTRQG
jgi:hypothetical protein